MMFQYFLLMIVGKACTNEDLNSWNYAMKRITACSEIRGTAPSCIEDNIACAGMIAADMQGKDFSINATTGVKWEGDLGIEYTYKVVVGEGGSVTQTMRNPPYSSWKLGNYASRSGLVENYDGGDNCSGFNDGRDDGSGRRSQVIFSFGDETKILSVSEPMECYYEFHIQVNKAICEEVNMCGTDTLIKMSELDEITSFCERMGIELTKEVWEEAWNAYENECGHPSDRPTPKPTDRPTLKPTDHRAGPASAATSAITGLASLLGLIATFGLL